MSKAVKSKVVLVSEIATKPRSVRGEVYPAHVAAGHQAEIHIGEKITLFGVEKVYPYGASEPESKSYRVEFKIGDMAEYDSYNLAYLGKVVAITEKTISIQPNVGSKVHRLSLYEFDMRNHDFNLEEVRKRNSDVMMSI